jgi:TRAP-type C4-dicarboxylate transport system substrate-binding protein
LLAVDKKVFDKLAEADQKVVRKIMGEAFLQIDKQNRADNISAFDALTQQGIELIKPDQQQIATWQQTAQIATDKLLSSGQISRESLDLMEQLLNEYRSKHNSADAK